MDKTFDNQQDLYRALDASINNDAIPAVNFRVIRSEAELSELQKNLEIKQNAPGAESKYGTQSSQVPKSEPQIAKNVEVSTVTLCDELAAHPSDPNRMAKGVAMKEIIPLRAYNACKADITTYPNTPRFFYQYGRAAEASNKREVSILSYLKASSMGYAMADFNLGYLYAETDKEENIKTAVEYYEKAIKGGVLIAQEYLDNITFVPTGFKAGYLLKKLYNNEKIEDPVQQVKLYIGQFIGPYYRSDVSECRQLVDNGAFMATMLNGTLGNLGTALGNPMGYANMARSAEDDGLLFNNRYGCNSIVARHMFRSMQQWAVQH